MSTSITLPQLSQENDPGTRLHYESILRWVVRQHMPSTYRIGTGFIYDTITDKCSPQSDLIIYSDAHESPLYHKEGVVVVAPHNVISCCEIKKKLTKRNLCETIAKYAFSNIGQSWRYQRCTAHLDIFCYECSISSDTLANVLVEELEKFISIFRMANHELADQSIAIQRVNMPQIYFVDRREYINTSIEHGENCSAKFKVSVNPSIGQDSLGELLGDLYPIPQSTDRNNCNTTMLIKKGRETGTTSDFHFIEKVSTAQLLQVFPSCREWLVQKSSMTNAVYAALVPAHIRYKKYRSLSDLEKEPYFRWLFTNIEPAKTTSS